MKIRIYQSLGALALAAMVTMLIAYAQEKPRKDNASGNVNNMSDMTEEMNKRGDHVMGLDHTKTAHHFRLLTDGGAIEVTANTAEDTGSRDEIRMHLGHIAKMFASGNFNAPMLIHDQTPPGVPVMHSLKDKIKYRFQEIDRGAAVHISTNIPEALQAIYAFLRFQIKEHKTGDTLEVSQ